MTYLEYLEKFEKMQRWVITDLKRATLDAKANFLVAMGIFNYIEVLGSFYKVCSSSTKRFDFVFEELLPTSYKSVFQQLQNLTDGAYDCLRCGMSHEYLIKTYNIRGNVVEIRFTIYGVDDELAYDFNVNSQNCGVELASLGQTTHLRIYNPRLIYDLNFAFEELKHRLKNNQSDYRANFVKRCNDIRLELL